VNAVGYVLVVDPHPIFRRGLVACLSALDEVDRVCEAADVDAARELWVDEVDLLVIDHVAPGTERLLGELAGTRVRAIVCSACTEDARVRASIRAGAMGFLDKDTLQPETLLVGLIAAANGACVLAPDLLGTLLAGDAPAGHRPRPQPGPTAGEPPPGDALAGAGQLTARERDVLGLIAQGEPTREVAMRLCYSERTVKNVLHDVALKLGARSRSQAVAHAVRYGLI
jgi:DNA-binding NarL/FixJ family response regulator